MKLKTTALLLAGMSLLAALWLRWWLQPERQIPRAQARLLSCIERRDFAAMEAMLSATYRDRWQHDRAGVVAHSREVLGHFATLTILREPRGLRAESGTWFLSEKIVLRGFGDPLAMAAREAVGALHGPFVMEWRPRTWKPWDWELQSVIQPELDVP